MIAIGPAGTFQAPAAKPLRADNAAWLRAARQRAVAAGNCQQCRARPAKPGRKTCQVCLDAQAARKRANVAAGRCHCGKRRFRGATSCRDCLDRNAMTGRKLRAARKERGLCVRHGCNEKAHNGRVHCEIHAAENTSKTHRIQDARLAAGLCVDCKRPNEKRTWRCDQCAAKARTRVKSRKANRTETAERIEEHW